MHEEDEELVFEETPCLGWCNKTFLSPDKKKIRFCDECRRKRERAGSLSKRETTSCHSIVPELDG